MSRRPTRIEKISDGLAPGFQQLEFTRSGKSCFLRPAQEGQLLIRIVVVDNAGLKFRITIDFLNEKYIELMSRMTGVSWSARPGRDPYPVCPFWSPKFIWSEETRHLLSKVDNSTRLDSPVFVAARTALNENCEKYQFERGGCYWDFEQRDEKMILFNRLMGNISENAAFQKGKVFTKFFLFIDNVIINKYANISLRDMFNITNETIQQGDKDYYNIVNGIPLKNDCLFYISRIAWNILDGQLGKARSIFNAMPKNQKCIDNDNNNDGDGIRLVSDWLIFSRQVWGNFLERTKEELSI